MAQHEEIVLWLDRRWKNAIEKHLMGETLQEHLETVLDELCNRLPEREYERISRAIQSEAAAQRAEEEAARTYAAYHVTECGQEWYFKTSPGEELLTVGKKLRSYITSEKAAVPDLFIKMFAGGRPITAEAVSYTHLHQPLVYENHGIDARYTGPHQVVPTMSARYGTGGNNVPLVEQEETFCPSSCKSLPTTNPNPSRSR